MKKIFNTIAFILTIGSAIYFATALIYYVKNVEPSECKIQGDNLISENLEIAIKKCHSANGFVNVDDWGYLECLNTEFGDFDRYDDYEWVGARIELNDKIK